VGNLWINFLVMAALVAALIHYRGKAMRKFDADPVQHELVKLLLALAAHRHDVSEADVDAYLEQVSKNRTNRRARVIHAVLTIRAKGPPVLYPRVLELSQRLK
jgi:hypothetical protein